VGPSFRPGVRAVTADTATEQLVRAHEYTDERGYATAEVVAEPYVERSRLFVPIEVLTTGTRHTLEFELPSTWSDQYPVVRLVESVGYGPGGIELLVGERFPVEFTDGSADADAEAVPEPVFDPEGSTEPARTVAGVTVPELSRETIGRGAVDTLRLAGRSAQYGVALAAFSLVVAVGALVAATVTYAVVLGGLLVTSLVGAAGTVGALLPVLVALVAFRAAFSRRIRSRRPDDAASRPHRTHPELDRYR